jgi:hypothetical protein
MAQTVHGLEDLSRLRHLMVRAAESSGAVSRDTVEGFVMARLSPDRTSRPLRPVRGGSTLSPSRTRPLPREQVGNMAILAFVVRRTYGWYRSVLDSIRHREDDMHAS